MEIEPASKAKELTNDNAKQKISYHLSQIKKSIDYAISICDLETIYSFKIREYEKFELTNEQRKKLETNSLSQSECDALYYFSSRLVYRDVSNEDYANKHIINEVVHALREAGYGAHCLFDERIFEPYERHAEARVKITWKIRPYEFVL